MNWAAQHQATLCFCLLTFCFVCNTTKILGIQSKSGFHGSGFPPCPHAWLPSSNSVLKPANFRSRSGWRGPVLAPLSGVEVTVLWPIHMTLQGQISKKQPGHLLGRWQVQSVPREGWVGSGGPSLAVHVSQQSGEMCTIEAIPHSASFSAAPSILQPFLPSRLNSLVTASFPYWELNRFL